MRLLIAVLMALVAIFGSLFGLRRCNDIEMPPSTRVVPVLSAGRA